MASMIRRWLADRIRRRSTVYRIATDDRTSDAIIALASISGILSAIYEP